MKPSLSLVVDQDTGPSPVPSGKAKPDIYFNRFELQAVLALYGQRVARGEWRDYGISGGKDQATFAIFRRSHEFPLYRIIKEPQLARRQGAFRLLAASGQVLKRGHEIDQVLSPLRPKLDAI